MVTRHSEASTNALKAWGVPEHADCTPHFAPWQTVGGTVESLGHDGLLVASMRSPGDNLILFPRRMDPLKTLFEVIDVEVL